MAKRTVVQLPIYLSETQRDAVHEYARRRGFAVTADYIRELIAEDMTRNGEAIDLRIERGGDRTPPADEPRRAAS